MASIDFSSNSFWNSSDFDFSNDALATDTSAGLDLFSVDNSISKLANDTAKLLGDSSVDFHSGAINSTSTLLSADSLGFKGLSDQSPSRNYTDFVDWRGPSQIDVVNLSTKPLGNALEWAGDGLAKKGGKIGIIGGGLSAVGRVLTKYPLTATYIGTETLPNTEGYSELRSKYFGVGLGDGPYVSGVHGWSASQNAGGYDLNGDGHRDGAYGLVTRHVMPFSKMSGDMGQDWKVFGAGAQIVDNLYYSPIGHGVSNALASGVVGSFGPSAKPVVNQIGVRLPTDAAELGSLADHNWDFFKTEVLAPATDWFSIPSDQEEAAEVFLRTPLIP